MARLVRCSSFFLIPTGRNLPVSGCWPVAANDMKPTEWVAPKAGMKYRVLCDPCAEGMGVLNADADKNMVTGINHGSLSLGLSGSTEELGQSLHQEPCGTTGSNKRFLPCSGVLERGQEGLGLRGRLRSSHIWGIWLCSWFVGIFSRSSNSQTNDERTHGAQKKSL